MLFLINAIFLLLYSSTIEAIPSSTCWDGTLAVDYTGTISTTTTGRTCQAWSQNTPHNHTYHGAPLFPYDGDDVAAQNYCRDPDGYTGWPWCYTMDPSQRFDYCTVPICSNLPCSGGETIGQSNTALYNTNIDANTGKTYMQKGGSPYEVTCCGTIKEWKVYVRNPGTIKLQAWRPDGGTSNYILLGENEHSYTAGEINMEHVETELQNLRISVQQGDLIGWYTAGVDMVSYNAGSFLTATLTSAATVGVSTDFTSATVTSTNDYGIGAVLAESLSPYFTNTANTVTIYNDVAVGNTIFTLTIADDDTNDVSSLAVTMDTNMYFNHSGTNVTVKAALVVGSYLLNFTVTDRCSKTGVFSLNVTVVPYVVSISNLPTTANVSESETGEKLVHTLTFTSVDNYTCIIDSYIPTRPEGNPFLIQNNPTSDIGVYLKAGANIRYNVTTSYNITITCNNSPSSNDTDYLIINVDPNIMPVFTSFQSSLTINASTTSMYDIVYTATVTDTDGGPVTMTLECHPSPAPFLINNNLNVKPIFTNLPTTTQFVLENQSVGTSIYQVSTSDPNGDTVTLSVIYNNASCASLYALNTADGTITTSTVLVYGVHPNCTLNITGFDGLTNSDTETIDIHILNVDEPPVFSSTGYVITTQEVVNGTALPNVSIGATDPDNTAVTLSLACTSDPGYLTIHPTTGIVTMATTYDIETAPTNPYTISCDVIATDATSQSATSTLKVIISDGNDNAPIFTSPSYTYYLTKGTSGTNIVGTVTASDADKSSPNNLVSYTISPSTHFTVGAFGSVHNTVDLSGVADGTSYTLTVTATDAGTPPQSAAVPVVISILSVLPPGNSTESSGTDEDGFFSNTGNVIFLALAIFVSAVMAAFLTFLICKYCRTKPVGVEKEKIPMQDVKEEKHRQGSPESFTAVSELRTSPSPVFHPSPTSSTQPLRVHTSFQRARGRFNRIRQWTEKRLD
ncbi:hypothetical protein ACF0H5_006602 [Mactra antiquata]